MGGTPQASMVEDTIAAPRNMRGAGIMIGRAADRPPAPLKVPAIALPKYARRGSNVWIDAGGALQAGPKAPGASPDRSATAWAEPTTRRQVVLVIQSGTCWGALKATTTRRVVFTDKAPRRWNEGGARGLLARI